MKKFSEMIYNNDKSLEDILFLMFIFNIKIYF